MGKKKKKSTIIGVDFIKAGGLEGVQPGQYGAKNITRNVAVKRIEQEYIAEELIRKEKELKILKRSASELNIPAYRIGDVREELKDKNKKKKKKNASKNEKDVEVSSRYGNLINAVPDDLAAFIRGADMSKEEKKHDKSSRVYYDDDEPKSKKKKGKKKKKKKNKDKLKLEGLVVKDKKDEKKKDPANKYKNEISERFKEVERLSKQNIVEIDATIEIVNDRVIKLTKSTERVRGTDTALSNLINAKSGLISARQRAASDIFACRTKAMDFEYKKSKDAASASQNDNDLIAKLLPGLMLGGTNSSNIQSVNEYIANTGKNKDGKKKKKKYDKADRIYYDDDEDELERREKELLKSGEIQYNSYDKNIEYEGTFSVAIVKGWSDGKWKFIAVDDYGNQLSDVPKSMLPSKASAQMKWDDDNGRAIDINTNRAYNVKLVPSI